MDGSEDSGTEAVAADIMGRSCCTMPEERDRKNDVEVDGCTVRSLQSPVMWKRTEDGGPKTEDPSLLAHRFTITMSPLNDCSVSVAPASPNDPRTDRLRPGVNELAGDVCNVNA